MALGFLRSDEAFVFRERHRAAPGSPPPDALRITKALRSELSDEHARALVDQIVLERRAFDKFADPTRLLFDRVGLEQATSPAIASYHASLIPDGAGVVDLGCGLGADSLAFARAGHRVVGVERDTTRAALAAHNLAAGSSGAPGIASGHVIAGDGLHLPVRGSTGRAGEPIDVLYVDPDRRVDGRSHRRRDLTLGDLSPSWEEIRGLSSGFAAVLVKAPPALPDSEIPPEAAVAFLSEKGTCKEALLRIDAGRNDGAPVPGRRMAVLVEHGLVREIERGPRALTAESGRFLLDPDPALRRAGGVDALALEIGAARVSSEANYLFVDQAVDSPWARSYEVLDQFPYRQRDLVRRLREEPPSEIVVKQRGVAIPEASIRRGLPMSPDGPRVVLVLFERDRSRILCITAENGHA